MSCNYNPSTINNRLTQVVNAMDAGPSSGVLRLLDAGGNVLSSMQLAKPSGTVVGNKLTFNGTLLDPAAAGGGIPALARTEDSTGTVIISGLTVGGPGGTADILLSPTNSIQAGQVIAIQAAAITGH